MRYLALLFGASLLLGGATPVVACPKQPPPVTQISRSHWLCANGLTVITKKREKAIAVCLTGRVGKNVIITPHNVVTTTEGMHLK